MRIIFFIFFAFISTFSFSQNWVDLGNLYWRLSPYNSVDSSSEQRNLNTITFNVKAPLILNKKNLLIIGLEYQYNSVSANKKSDDFDKLEFSSSMLQFGWEHKWNTKSKMLFMTIGRLNSNFNSVDDKHFQLGGLVLGTTARSKKFQWKYGVYYNGEYFGPMIVPLFGFNWKINKKWRLKTIIPMNLELSYFPRKRFRTGLFFEGINASYLIIHNNETNDFYVDKADNNLSWFTEFNLGKNIWFHFKAGYSILRGYDTYESEDQISLKIGSINLGDNRPETPPMFENGWSIETRIIYRFPLPD